MRPVAVFRHTRTEGPGYLSQFLESRGISWQLIALDAGASVPDDPLQFSGLCFMGGTMSVNDPLPWIEPVCALIRAAIAAGVPVIGHCLGGQLMSKALGGTVRRNPVKEIGWGKVQASQDDTARHWLGEFAGRRSEAFHWHGETFSLPPGATPLLSSDACANQGFALGPHLGLQCHIEMTPEMILRWNKGWPAETAGLDPLPASVQRPETMLEELDQRLPALRQLADQLYGVWTDGLK